MAFVARLMVDRRSNSYSARPALYTYGNAGDPRNVPVWNLDNVIQLYSKRCAGSVCIVQQ